MPALKTKEEYEKWKAEKAKNNIEKLEKQKEGKIKERIDKRSIEVVCGKCGNKNIYNPEDKKERCDSCGEWLYQYITTSVSAPERARTIKSGMFSLFFSIIAACGTFIPLLTVGDEITGYKYYVWDGFGGNLIGLLFVFYGLILASIVFSLLNIYLNKKKFKASSLVVSIILVILTLVSYHKAQEKFYYLLAKAKVGMEFPLSSEEYNLSEKLSFDLNYAYKEGAGLKKGLGFWLIIFSNISTALVTGRKLMKSK